MQIVFQNFFKILLQKFYAEHIKPDESNIECIYIHLHVNFECLKRKNIVSDIVNFIVTDN